MSLPIIDIVEIDDLISDGTYQVYVGDLNSNAICTLLAAASYGEVDEDTVKWVLTNLAYLSATNLTSFGRK
jgi:hypothetical protein